MTNEAYSPTDRRPVNARDWRFTERLSNALIRARVNPNHISVSGVVFCALAGVAFSQTDRVGASLVIRLLWLAGAVLILLRGMANVLDGMVAVGAGTASRKGELFNDIPDRFSDAFIHIGFGCAAFSNPTLGWIAAIAAILTAYIRVLGKACGVAQDFRGPMAKTHRMYLLVVAAFYCALTPEGWQVLRLGKSSVGIPVIVLVVIIVGCTITIMRRLIYISRELDRQP